MRMRWAVDFLPCFMSRATTHEGQTAVNWGSDDRGASQPGIAAGHKPEEGGEKKKKKKGAERGRGKGGEKEKETGAGSISLWVPWCRTLSGLRRSP